jgi:hypothetical protein
MRLQAEVATDECQPSTGSASRQLPPEGSDRPALHRPSDNSADPETHSRLECEAGDVAPAAGDNQRVTLDDTARQ